MRLDKMTLAVDAHACGEPGRVIVGGVIDVPGRTMFEKKEYLEAHSDGLRTRMLQEPRGYPALCCNLIVPPVHPDADAGFIIMEQTEYPAMSGSNTICVATVLVETGMIAATEPVTRLTLESPAGLIAVDAEVSNGKVTKVTFENVPAFAVHLEKTVVVPELGDIIVDVAYGGMFYAIADAEPLGLTIEPGNGKRLARVGEMIKVATREQLPAVHPDNSAISGVTISQISGPASQPNAHRRNAVVVSTGALDWNRPETWTGVIDRSPCGTGTCAKMAVLYAKGRLGIGEEFVHEGILGTTFTGKLVRAVKVGPYQGAVPTLSGRAWITGFSQHVVDPGDPFPDGFTIGDIWG